MKLRKKWKMKFTNVLFIIFFLVFSCSFFMIHYFNHKINPQMFKIIEFQVNKFSKDIVMKSFNKKLLANHDINKIIKITKNKKDEIIAVDFDIEKAYDVSLNLTANIRNNLQKYSNNSYDNILFKPLDNSHGFQILLPLGSTANNPYLANLGPKIPIQILLSESLTTGLKTKVKDYGINNALIELYININLAEEILIPFDKQKINNNYEILLSSQIVEGVVPSIYNGLLENSSSLINVPLNE